MGHKHKWPTEQEVAGWDARHWTLFYLDAYKGLPADFQKQLREHVGDYIVVDRLRQTLAGEQFNPAAALKYAFTTAGKDLYEFVNDTYVKPAKQAVNN